MNRLLLIILFTACASTNLPVINPPVTIPLPPPVIIPPPLPPVVPPPIVIKRFALIDSFPIRIDHATYDLYTDIAINMLFNAWGSTSKDSAFQVAYGLYNFAKEHLINQANNIRTTVIEDSTSTRIEIINKWAVTWIFINDSTPKIRIQGISGQIKVIPDSLALIIYTPPITDTLPDPIDSLPVIDTTSSAKILKRRL